MILFLGFDPDKLDKQYVDRIKEAAPDMRVIVTRDRDTIEEILDEVEIAAAGFPQELICKAPKLRWLQQWGGRR